MRSSIISLCDKIIPYSFYTLFALIPLVVTNSTSELFELNKMWITWGMTIIILTAWITKMIVQKEFRVQRTPLDIPIILFLISQLISTFISLDSHVSWWGYYSRFNGGMLSLLSYAFLYYAYVSNISREQVFTTLKVILGTGIFVALWGLPSHFGADPTCLLFRGTLDVTCWTEAFKPTIRIFSTLGQPAWLAAYLAALIPLSVAYTISASEKKGIPNLLSFIKDRKTLAYFAVTALFYLDLLYANTRGGFLAFWVANILFWGILFIKRYLPVKRFFQYAVLFNATFLIFNFFSGTPLAQLDIITLSGIQKAITPTPMTPATTNNPVQPSVGGTESGNIRLYVWKGAIDAWRASPIFGSGVETFAYAYYQHRPAGHNLTSEWDYLYNKAHNEYLNYLTTTGIFGLTTYLSVIGFFLFLVLKNIFYKKQDEENSSLSSLLSIALPAGFVSILVSNFFGFSVVMMNVFLFFFPLFYFSMNKSLNDKKVLKYTHPQEPVHLREYVNPYQWSALVVLFLISTFSLFLLLRFWQADKAYALGYNLSRVGDIQGAYNNLTEAVKIRPAEPVFQDEYAVNLATIANALQQNNEATSAAQFAQEAVTISDTITTNHPNNVTFWKSRVRIFYLLSELNPSYNTQALSAIEKAVSLAPTDAKVQYNYGVLLGQNGNVDKAIEVLSKTIELKPDYRDAYFARGLFYRQTALNESGRVNDLKLNELAIQDMKHILENIDKEDQAAQNALKEWGVN